jgi:Zn-dependent protease
MENIPYRTGVLHIRVRLHNTWLLAFFVVTFIVSTNVQQTVAMWNRLIAGTEIVCVFITVLFLRQFVLSLIATAQGVPLRRVTLYIIGGVPGIPRQFTSPKIELLLALAGFAVSIAGILIFYLAYILMVINNANWLGDLTIQLIFLMALFFLFHLLPAYPLDGGRVLRALLWRKNNDYDSSTRTAAVFGIFTGAVVTLIGIGLAFTGQPWFICAILVVIGSAIWIATGETLSIMRLRRYLLGTTVYEVPLNIEVPLVERKMSLDTLVRKYVHARGAYFFVTVGPEGRSTGYFTLQDIMKVPRKLWNSRTVDSISTRADRIYGVEAGQTAADVLEQMMVMDIEGMPVFRDDTVIGVVERENLLHLTKMRKDIGAVSGVFTEKSKVHSLWLRARTVFDR